MVSQSFQIPNELKQEYPFLKNTLLLEDHHKLNFVDEGKGEPILMVHGNPTWSFYYRNLIKEFSSTNRIIVPDHIGCGLSDKPQDYDYSLKNHVDNLESLILKLDLKDITLIVHDWGGAIGLGVATRHPERFKKLVLLNTAAFTDTVIPWRIDICRNRWFGERVIRHLNGFAWPATFMATKKKLNPVVKKGFLLPYNNYKNRIATARFVQDIPLKETHPSYPELDRITNQLKNIKVPTLILWGGKDFCFNKHYFDKWCSLYPHAETNYYPKAGHYILEDEKDSVLKKIGEFIK